MVAASLTVAGCGQRRPVADPAYLASLEKFRAHRLARLTADDGWLTLQGLFWLHPGLNRVGSAATNEVVLRGREVPPVAGTLEVTADRSVVLHTAAESGITLGGSPPGERALRSDRTGTPDVLQLARLSFYVIERGDSLAVRVKDPDSPARRGFEGLRYFPVDPRYRVEGRFEPYAAPRAVMVASHQGPPQRMIAPGLVRFTLLGHALALEPLLESPDDRDFFFVFRDATSGVETYGACRFLDADAPAAGSNAVVLDFNEATNPPCAFTPYATCPLPPPQNVMPLRIEAGEELPAGAAH